MLLNNIWGNASLRAVLAAASLVTASGLSGATVPNTAPNVTFIAAGTFSTPQVSGNDTLKLSGEPFAISIVANAASAPIQHGRNWALFSPFKMTGEVHSGLLGSTPVNIASTGTSIFQAVGPSYDPIQTAFPVKVVGISLTISAEFTLPPGTLPSPLIHTFAAVALGPANSTVTYSNGTDTTTLTIQSGSLIAKIASGDGQTAGVLPAIAPPYTNGARVVTAQSLAPMDGEEPPVSSTIALHEASALVSRRQYDLKRRAC
jgi:hypothetical protein